MYTCDHVRIEWGVKHDKSIARRSNVESRVANTALWSNRKRLCCVQQAPPYTPASPVVARSQALRPPSRVGKKVVSGYFDPDVSKQLARLGIDQDRTNEHLLREALNDLFTKYQLPPIA